MRIISVRSAREQIALPSYLRQKRILNGPINERGEMLPDSDANYTAAAGCRFNNWRTVSVGCAPC